jgi:uncharacterized membrane protein
MSNVNKAICTILLVAISGAVGSMACVIFKPGVGEKFTEFYVLGTEGMADNYPLELEVGEKGAVELGIINREGEEITYRIGAAVNDKEVKLWRNAEEYDEIEPIELSHEEKWEGKVYFVPHKVGTNQKLEFILYREGKPQGYRTLYLLLEVYQ